MRIEASGVAKRFGRVQALADVSFSAASGSRVALVGPNGSGKTTLIRAVMGLVACTGSLRVAGHSPLRGRAQIAAQMAYVPQVAPQSGAPVGEIVDALSRLRGIDGKRLDDLARHLELDLGAIARLPMRALSGGTRQKLLLALAFASEASLFILDEPTASLDSRTRERFFGLFAELDPRTTLLLCSHRIEELRPLVDQVLALESGRVAYDGPASGFLDARAMSVIEVAVEPSADTVLHARGFRPGAQGWWMRAVTRKEKPRVVEALLRELGPAVRDLNVRELETLELDAVRKHMDEHS